MRTRSFFVGIFLAGLVLFSFNFIRNYIAHYERPIVVVIPSYNNKDWYKKNLDSVLSQVYSNFRVIYTDDHSDDGTASLVKEYLLEHDKVKRVTFIENPERIGALGNMYQMVSSCNKNDIIVSVSGDDWLYDPHVLHYINRVYSDPNVWMTYGQFLAYPLNAKGFASQVPQEVIDQNSFRTNGGHVTHLKTFYAGLFQKVKHEDLLYQGKYYQMAGETAYLLPMLEMAGNHSKFTPRLLYVYNMNNPISDEKVDRSFQQQLDMDIRSKEKYQPIAQF